MFLAVVPLEEIIRSLTSILKIIDLENTEVRDKCLKSIGIHCSKLRYFSLLLYYIITFSYFRNRRLLIITCKNRSLNLTHFRYVTDTGNQWLCNVDYPGMGNGKSGLCETIKKIKHSSYGCYSAGNTSGAHTFTALGHP